MGVIYKITSPSDKLYVGKTYDIYRRICDYRCKRYRSKKSLIISSIKKYGWANHRIEVIEEVEENMLNEREIFWISELRTYGYENEKGMNLTKGGDGQRHSWKHDKERVKIARLRKGENSPGWGKKHSEDSKKIISIKIKEHHKKNNTQFPPLARERNIELRSQPIIAYDHNGIFISEHKNSKLAASTLGLDRKSVNDAANGVQVHSGGYFFRKKTNNYPTNIDISDKNILRQKREVYCLIGSFIISYKSCNKAAQDLGLYNETVRGAARRNDLKPIRKGYKFMYKDLYEKMMKPPAYCEGANSSS